MTVKNFIRTILLGLFCFFHLVLKAADESYIETIEGSLASGNSCTVTDDKFLNLPLAQWNQLRNISVTNLITFELRNDVPDYYHNKLFTCNLNISIKYWSTRDQITPTEINNIDLVVKYDPGTTAHSTTEAKYQFNNAFKVEVTVNSITSTEWGVPVPPIFIIKNRILVERKYPFISTVNALLLFTKQNTGGSEKLIISWNHNDFDGPDDFGGPEEFDIEWTYIDQLYESSMDSRGKTIADYIAGTITDIPDATMEEWMRNDNTRVTVTSHSYEINLPYTDGYIFVRIRGVYYDEVTNLRRTTNWSYRKVINQPAFISIGAHQSNLNWQYTGAFAEEGKRKEVISYLDGSLRSRQAVAINNSDLTMTSTNEDGARQETAIVQETIYDNMGRPAVNILPAPRKWEHSQKGSVLKYYPLFNNNFNSQPYSHSDILLTQSGVNCTIAANALGITTGAGQYYSPSNQFIGDGKFSFTQFVPDSRDPANSAKAYPLTLTEYMPDNTGRIRRQGGVGAEFQIGSGHETQYYYGKPTPKELKRLFGMEVGNASHYLKNMVIDPNGQASVSYIDANGKTIATALAGKAPDNLDELPSLHAPESTFPLNDAIIQPGDFNKDAGSLIMQATASFVAAVTGNFQVQYNVNPSALVTTHNQGQFCSNCEYEVIIEVRNDCGDLKASVDAVAFSGNDITCYTNRPAYSGSVTVDINKVGEYKVNYILRLKQDVINDRVDYYIANNTDLKTLQTFFLEELNKIDLEGCYNTCEGCKTLGNDVTGFRAKIMDIVSTDKFSGVEVKETNGDPKPWLDTWINTSWTALKAKCNTISCTVAPCEDYLQMMQLDVLPGGQYALYNADNNGVVTLLEPAVNVLNDYKNNPLISNFEFVDENGNTRHIKDGDVSITEFMNAYLQHPEWASDFVKLHVEYCSYEWCKKQTTSPTVYKNEDSYTFDKKLKEEVSTGSEAAVKGWFNKADILTLLNSDPFFNAPAYTSHYHDEMSQDLATLSSALKMTPKDENGNFLSTKNIFQFIDWALYCKPSIMNPTTTQLVDSWQACVVNDNCRSQTREWELYRNYYLKLKSKYVRLAKLTDNPSCSDCFIGDDVYVQSSCIPPGPLSDYSIGGGMVSQYIRYKNGTEPFKDNYSFVVRYTATGTLSVVIGTKGTYSANLVSPQGGDPMFELVSVICAPTVPLANCTDMGGTVAPCPVFGDFSVVEKNHVFNDVDPVDGTGWYENSADVYIRHNNGPVNRDVTVSATFSEILGYYGQSGIITSDKTVTIPAGDQEIKVARRAINYYMSNGQINPDLYYEATISFPGGVNCPAVTPLPASTCKTDGRYLLYIGKNRVFNDYVNEDAYSKCMAANVDPNFTPDTNLDGLRTKTKEDIDFMAISWLDKLRGVVATENAYDVERGQPERFASLKDVVFGSTFTAHPTLVTLVDKLATVAKRYVEVAPNDNIRPASTLPPSIVAGVYHSFEEVFADVIGITLMQQGFNQYLLDDPYPYDKSPFATNPSSGDINPDICANLAILKTRAGSMNFHNFLKQELGDEYTLTAAQLAELETRCTNGCLYMNDYVTWPIAFLKSQPANTDHPFVTCSRVSTLRTDFENAYPAVAADKTLMYRVLLTNYINHNLGHSASYADYANFIDADCPANANAVLYNKATSPYIPVNDFGCAQDIVKGAFERAGQEYDRYIVIQRNIFRNDYISKCMSTGASAILQGDQHEYHYTLYYYDQAGNLVKTIPPEGVSFLSDSEIALVDEFRDINPATCTGADIIAELNPATSFSNFSTQLTGNAKSVEMWLYNSTTDPAKHVRFATPDNKYLYQAAIKNNMLWVELYSLTPGTGGDIEITLSNHAVGDISSIAVQPWSHVMVQASDFLGGAWDLYLDGRKLSLVPESTAPSYPYEWEIAAGFTLPASEYTVLKHLRMYRRLAADAEVYANYKNSCLSPVEKLKEWDYSAPGDPVNNPLTAWGRFNVPAPGGPTTTGPGSTTEYIDRFIVPNHGLPTNYAYNSLNQVIKQSSPDAGSSEFWYDRLGKLVISQNAEQKSPLATGAEHSANRYSYTRYDALGRIIEVGEKINSGAAVIEETARVQTSLDNFYTLGTNRQITFSIYDAVPANWVLNSAQGILQRNLRKRVAISVLLPQGGNPAVDVSARAASYYSYDISGNVDQLVQESPLLKAYELQKITGSDGYKRIKYKYDLISGKVNKVLYQDGKWDQFYYQYAYDADNRVIKSLTSRVNYNDANLWIQESLYRYYLHGPLARMELGKQQVQGVDYAYTLQGWLKGVNGQTLNPDWDMGTDGFTDPDNINKDFARDVYGFSLGYYNNDYKEIRNAALPTFGLHYQAPSGLIRNSESGKELFNGNISHAIYALSNLDAPGKLAGYTYRYDQLNRLTAMNRHDIDNTSFSWGNNSIMNAYKESIVYDANGNIEQYNRAGTVAKPAMDVLTYGYNKDAAGKKLNNKLRIIKDDVPSSEYAEDIDDQLQGANINDPSQINYEYDQIGNLIKDKTPNEKLDKIHWTVYGKIAYIEKENGVKIRYEYDATGNRLSKTVTVAGIPTTTHYLRDAQGNVLSVYEYIHALGSASVEGIWLEQHLYGSSRLGMVTPHVLIAAGQGPTINDAYNITNDLVNDHGNRQYELSNHLGNVLTVISDRKIGVDVGNNGTTDHYVAELMSSRDYYPFGMLMPGRSWDNGNYRYGFNGKENDDDIKGIGNQQDYGMRIYDPRLGRFLSVDPLTKSYPWYTPYSFAGNKPIWAIDVDGAEEYIKTFKYEDGKATLLRIVQNSEIRVRFTSNSEKNGQTPFVRDIIDKRTGKPMSSAEIGQVQHQYVDSKGNKLNIRRDYNGNYVSGDNEMMTLGENNLFGSIYIGPTNPTYIDANRKERPDYRREPQDEVDAAALQHDKDYDDVNAAGASDAFYNRKTIPADKKLVAAATAAERKGKAGGIDNVTGKPVNSQTQSRAKWVRNFFNYLLKAPAFKGNPPPPEGADRSPGTHVIK